MADEVSFDSLIDDYSICKPFYKLKPFIPSFGEDSTYRIISSTLECTILLFLTFTILRKKYYICIKKDYVKAKSILLPYYDRIIYYYLFATLIRVICALLEYLIIKYHIVDQIENEWWMVLSETLSYSSLIGLELFILLLLLQASVGRNAFKRAFIATATLMIYQFALLTIKHFLGDESNNFFIYNLCEICIHSSLLIIYITVFCYVKYKERYKNRIRDRNRILYQYIAFISIMDIILLIAFILLMFHIDGFCFVIIDEYLYRLLFPIVVYFTVKRDSEFWANILFQWQLSSKSSLQRSVSNELSPIDSSQNSKASKSDDIDIIFGNSHHSERRPSHYDPLIDALSMDVNIIDFKDLHEISDPIAVGSTAMVSKAKLFGKIDVAVKIFILDELSMDIVQQFFRETLLINNINHQNIVQFKGACLRPPDLCLVYEYCSCGDLAHLMLTRYYNKGLDSNQLNENIDYDDAKLFSNRLLILIDIARGMLKLHDSNMIHRDLKTSNVLVHYDKALKKYIGKVCDFGSARKLTTEIDIINDFENGESINSSISDQIDSDMTTQVGTFVFLAPEIMAHIDVSGLSGSWIHKKNNYNNSTENENGNEVKMAVDEYKTLEMSHSLPAYIKDNKGKIVKNNKGLKFGKKNDLENNYDTVDVAKLKNINYDGGHHETKTFLFGVNDENDDMVNHGLLQKIIYDKSVDVYSFAVIMWEIGYLMRIYDNMDLDTIYNIVCIGKRMNILDYEYCQRYTDNGFNGIHIDVYNEYIKLMNICWSQIPRDRPSFDEIEERLTQIYQLHLLKQNKIFSFDI